MVAFKKLIEKKFLDIVKVFQARLLRGFLFGIKLWIITINTITDDHPDCQFNRYNIIQN
jgi:hypothetical protein